jgi:hypothetical protein
MKKVQYDGRGQLGEERGYGSQNIIGKTARTSQEGQPEHDMKDSRFEDRKAGIE